MSMRFAQIIEDPWNIKMVKETGCFLYEKRIFCDKYGEKQLLQHSADPSIFEA